MKFQFNKTELQRIRKDLKVRYAALPTLKNKESALRAEIKRFKKIYQELESNLNKEIGKLDSMIHLFCEYKNYLKVENVKVGVKKIAGVRIPVLEDMTFSVSDFSPFNSPSWLFEGMELVKKVSRLKTELKVEAKRIEILEYARKKTTQKVNLYEKVQIPEFEDAIIKIKRFLEDEENLDRASQKIVKKRKAAVL